mgnify:FL=1
MYKKQLDIREAKLGKDDFLVAAATRYKKAIPFLDVVCFNYIPYRNLAELYKANGRYHEAQKMFHKMVSSHSYFLPQKTLNFLIKVGIVENARPPGHLQYGDVATALTHLGDFYYHFGKYKDAEPAYQRALQIRERYQADAPLDLAVSLEKVNNY